VSLKSCSSTSTVLLAVCCPVSPWHGFDHLSLRRCEPSAVV
jgi:hypothetical protein